MLKKLFVVLSLLTTVTILADEAATWNWNLDDETSLKSVDLSKVSDTIKNLVIPAQLALVGKNAENITYEQFKEIIQNALKDADGPSYDKTKVLAYVARNVSRFNKFKSNVVNDPDLNTLSYVKYYIAPEFYNTPESFRKYYFEDKMVINNGHYTLEGITIIFKLYKKYSFNYTDDQIKKDMKFLKRAVYPNIDRSEEWKTLAVKIELMLKSAE